MSKEPSGILIKHDQCGCHSGCEHKHTSDKVAKTFEFNWIELALAIVIVMYVYKEWFR